MTETAPKPRAAARPAEQDRATYALFDDGDLLLAEDRSPAPALAERVHGAFRALVLDPEFPCVAARSALNQASYRFAMYGEMASDAATVALARDLRTFVQEQPSIEGQYTTFIACFESPKVKDGEEFETLLWQQLASLHELDDVPWDESVSRDPDDPHFSFSFAGRGFFVVGLAPSGTRWARTFSWPLLAFNAHFQFEALRASGGFERMQEVVRDRDEKLQGDINPNLSDFGDHTDARQYAGREVEADWRCPVRFDA